MPNKSGKLSRREANHQSLKEWVKPKKIPRKLTTGVTSILQLYRQGNSDNLTTAKNEINKLTSTPNPSQALLNTLTKYTDREPTTMINMNRRHDKLEESVNSILPKFAKKDLNSYYVTGLLFTSQAQVDTRSGKALKADFIKYDEESQSERDC